MTDFLTDQIIDEETDIIFLQEFRTKYFNFEEFVTGSKIQMEIFNHLKNNDYLLKERGIEIIKEHSSHEKEDKNYENLISCHITDMRRKFRNDDIPFEIWNIGEDRKIKLNAPQGRGHRNVGWTMVPAGSVDT